MDCRTESARPGLGRAPAREAGAGVGTARESKPAQLPRGSAWDSEGAQVALCSPCQVRELQAVCVSPCRNSKKPRTGRDESDETGEEEQGSAQRAHKSRSPPAKKPATRPTALSEAVPPAPKKKSMTWNSDEESENTTAPSPPKKKKPKLTKPCTKKDEKREEGQTVRKWEDEEEAKLEFVARGNSLLTKFIARKKKCTFEAYIDREALLRDAVRSKVLRSLDTQIRKITDQLAEHATRASEARRLVKERVAFVVDQTSHGLFRLCEYGSFATGLLTPFSDMDLAVDCNGAFDRAHALDFLRVLHENLETCGFVRESKPILSASVPVIKLEADPSEEFEGLARAKTSTSVKVDIIIQTKEFFESEHASTRTTTYVQQARDSIESFSRLVVLLKYALNCADLMNSYKGGLNSYGLCLLYAGFARHCGLEKERCLGSALTQFIDFVLSEFDPTVHAMNLNNYNAGGAKCLSPKNLYGNTAPLVVFDPTHYVFCNVTSSCQNYAAVLDLLRGARSVFAEARQKVLDRFLPQLDSALETGLPPALDAEIDEFVAVCAADVLGKMLPVPPVDLS